MGVQNVEVSKLTFVNLNPVELCQRNNLFSHKMVLYTEILYYLPILHMFQYASCECMMLQE